MFGNFCCCKEHNEKCDCDRHHDNDCFRPKECCHREHFVKETRCSVNWRREDCKRDDDKKDGHDK